MDIVQIYRDYCLKFLIELDLLLLFVFVATL